LPLARSAQLIDDLYGLEVSPATLLAWIEEAGQVLRPADKSIAQALIEAPVVHAKRETEAIEAVGILLKRIITLLHDCLKPYWKLECVHVLCNVHLLRELVFLHESTGQTWPQRMIDILISARDTSAVVRPVTTALTQG